MDGEAAQCTWSPRQSHRETSTPGGSHCLPQLPGSRQERRTADGESQPHAQCTPRATLMPSAGPLKNC